MIEQSASPGLEVSVIAQTVVSGAYSMASQLRIRSNQVKLRSVLLLGAVICAARPTSSDRMVSPARSHEATTVDIFMKPTESSDLVSAIFPGTSLARYDSFSAHRWREFGKQRDGDNRAMITTMEPVPVSLRLTEPTCLTALGSGLLVLGSLGFRRRSGNTAGGRTVNTERDAGGSLDQAVRINKAQNMSATANSLEMISATRALKLPLPAQPRLSWQTFKGPQVRDCLREGQGVPCRE